MESVFLTNPNRREKENEKTYFEQFLYEEVTPIEENLRIADYSEVGLSWE